MHGSAGALFHTSACQLCLCGVRLSLLVQGVLVYLSALLLSAVFVWVVLKLSKRAHLFPAKCMDCAGACSTLCCLQCLCHTPGCQLCCAVCTCPCWCRVFWCIVPHVCCCQCLCRVFVVIKTWAPFFPAKCMGCAGACFHTSVVCSVCVGVLVFIKICAPFPAGAGCSGVSSRTSAVGSVCVGGFEVIRTRAPFPC